MRKIIAITLLMVFLTACGADTAISKTEWSWNAGSEFGDTVWVFGNNGEFKEDNHKGSYTIVEDAELPPEAAEALKDMDGEPIKLTIDMKDGDRTHFEYYAMLGEDLLTLYDGEIYVLTRRIK